MLPRFVFLFSRGPPSARSSQIRPHPVTVRHLSVSFLLPLSRRFRAAYSLTQRTRVPLARRAQQRLLSIAKWRTRVVWLRGGQESLALPDPSCKYAERVAPVLPNSTSLSEVPFLVTDVCYTRPVTSRALSVCSPCFFFSSLRLFLRPLMRRVDLVLPADSLFSPKSHTQITVTATEEKPNSCSRIYLQLPTTIL